MDAAVRTQAASADLGADGPHRPQSLLLGFLGGFVLGRDLPPLPAVVLLDLLGELGVTGAAARATLKRMTHRGLLERSQVGRTARYQLTALSEGVLSRAGRRVDSPTPFEHPEGGWTLLSYSMPETLRDLRHRVRSRLTWAGFGGLRDGLWIAPGTVDVAEVFAEAGLEDAAALADWFAAQPLAGTDVDGMVHRAWDVPAVLAAHQAFLQAWATPPAHLSELGRATLLIADWLRLLRTDPGLPALHLGPDWPAARSAELYQQTFAALRPGAQAALVRTVRAATGP
ncbi:PaaX family transcriptional regulator [Modestobacter marinus]|uniref:PaaX family transcriptional regulator n=1 Tax=Modestobacter marinus TaxID=477641 RepID=UPI00201A9AAF|nr:PaaX family transcriptional regulator C-terminal domain-containing protein [Modestobacter marinus]